MRPLPGQMPRAGAPFGRDPHLGHQSAAMLRRVTGEHPRGQAGFLVLHRPDDHVSVVDRLDEVIDRGTQRPRERVLAVVE